MNAVQMYSHILISVVSGRDDIPGRRAPKKEADAIAHLKKCEITSAYSSTSLPPNGELPFV